MLVESEMSCRVQLKDMARVRFHALSSGVVSHATSAERTSHFASHCVRKTERISRTIRNLLSIVLLYCISSFVLHLFVTSVILFCFIHSFTAFLPLLLSSFLFLFCTFVYLFPLSFIFSLPYIPLIAPGPLVLYLGIPFTR